MNESNSKVTRESAESKTSRRGFVVATGGLLAGAIGTTAGTAAGNEECVVDQFSYTLQRGMAYETDVHIVESERPGPTAVLFGGMHGDEPAGYRAAREIVDWEFDRGTLVIVPEADAEAVERGTRHSSAGYLNRQFPTGQQPTSGLARELWNTVALHDPELVVDMHSSRGIWDSDVGFDGYGQAIFPTSATGAREKANSAAATINDRYLDGYPSTHQFTVGNTLTGVRPMLIHKVAGDLDRPGYITEVTKDDTSLDERIEWTKSTVADLLRSHGIETGYARNRL